MVAGDLLARARAGDGEAFRELAESHRRELQVHCYRMLGSFADAEDAVQETMLAAWQGIGGFAEERASLRTWLYKIATSRCLNARRAARRRPAREWDMSQFEPPVPTPRDEPVWLQPFPDALLEGAAAGLPGPEARYEQSEAISLAFVTALQVLPPRQVAVLILRDVLGFHASEVAGMLEVTVGTARCTTTRGSTGPHNIIAAYSGTTVYMASTSAVLTQVVTKTPCASLARCNLSRLNLTAANLVGANLTSANLNRANLTGAGLADTNLTGANLGHANLTGADLTGVTVTRSTNLTKVTWADTTCPDGTNSNADGGTCASHL
jgi:RNA polymerase sigma factor (sigma-70 family)